MDESRNKFGIIFLILVLLLFIIGGYFFMKYMTDSPTKSIKDKITELKKEVRINDKKDYIYFENSEEIIDDVIKQDIVLNFMGMEEENNKLKQELEELSKKKEYVTTQVIPDGITCENNLYSFSYRNYEITEYDKYISVVLIDYDYNCVDGALPTNIKSYVINKEEGIIISNDELYTLFSMTEDKIIEGVNKRLTDTQVLDGDESVIDTETTINNVKNGLYGTNKALSISKNGKLVINFIVNSNKINYNDSIELN